MHESFEPLGDRVLLKRVDSGNTSKSGMIIPDSAKEKPTECEVVAVGPPFLNEFNTLLSPPCKVGDRVLIGKYSGSNELKLNGEDYLAIRWAELIGKITRETVN